MKTLKIIPQLQQQKLEIEVWRKENKERLSKLFLLHIAQN